MMLDDGRVRIRNRIRTRIQEAQKHIIPRIRMRIHNTVYKGADGTGKLPWRGHVWPQSRAHILLALIWTAQEPSQERTNLASIL
jgi:hypothetical protein